MITKVTAIDLMKLLQLKYPAPAWAFFPELRTGTGYGRDSQQFMDAWAISLYPSRGQAPFMQLAFEIKVSASDVKKELLNPDKRWLAYAYSHEFYFVAPEGLIDRNKLDVGDGLIEWDGKELRVTKQAKTREVMQPKWEFVASICRRVHSVDKRSWKKEDSHAIET